MGIVVFPGQRQGCGGCGRDVGGEAPCVPSEQRLGSAGEGGYCGSSVVLESFGGVACGRAGQASSQVGKWGPGGKQ